jgi:hypothetical protein
MYDEEWFIVKMGCLGMVLFIAFFFGLLCLNWEPSEDLVSGIVYNNVNNTFLGHNTRFAVRASADMYADEQTSVTYCLPPNSEYIPLVKEAAKDKGVRVVVETRKDFQVLWPWECMDNVTVTKEK